MSAPTLWHIPDSPYSEKVRWALAHKGVEPRRRAPSPPLHIPLAFVLTSGRETTFPVLELDGRRIGDSTEIIGALERRFPEPALYPAAEDACRRALDLEDWFDEEVGPPVRLLVWHEVTRDRPVLEKRTAEQLPASLARFRAPAAAGVAVFLDLRFGVKSDEAAEVARSRVEAGLDRLEEELGEGNYLVEDTFSIADLTAAALFFPLVMPPEGPRLVEAPPRALERFRAPLKGRRGYRWVEEIYRRHRRPPAA